MFGTCGLRIWVTKLIDNGSCQKPTFDVWKSKYALPNGY